MLFRWPRWGWSLLIAAACNPAPTQARFATPDEAAAALQTALKADDLDRMRAIFGREWIEASASGDAVADQHDREVVALAMAQSWRWAPRGEDTKELIIGDEQWPFPVPLIKSGERVAVRFGSRPGRSAGTAHRRERTRSDPHLPRLRQVAAGIRSRTARRQTGRIVRSTLS